MINEWVNCKCGKNLYYPVEDDQAGVFCNDCGEVYGVRYHGTLRVFEKITTDIDRAWFALYKETKSDLAKTQAEVERLQKIIKDFHWDTDWLFALDGEVKIEKSDVIELVRTMVTLKSLGGEGK